MDSAEEGAGSRNSVNKSIYPFRTRWSKEMEQLVVDLWEEHIDDYFGMRKRRVLYQQMADFISAQGFPVVWTDVRNKLENLTKKYRIEKERVSNGSPSRWRHYEKMHSLLSIESPRQIPESQEVKREVKREEVEDQYNDDDSEIPLENVDTDVDTQSELLIIAREQLQIQREEQVFNREHRRAQLKVLKYIARSQDRLHSLLVQLLTDTNDDDE